MSSISNRKGDIFMTKFKKQKQQVNNLKRYWSSLFLCPSFSNYTQKEASDFCRWQHENVSSCSNRRFPANILSGLFSFFSFVRHSLRRLRQTEQTSLCLSVCLMVMVMMMMKIKSPTSSSRLMSQSDAAAPRTDQLDGGDCGEFCSPFYR